MPRLFTAIELAPDTKQAVQRQQALVAANLKSAGASLRLMPAEQLHLTVVFIGQVDEARAQAVADAMRADLSLPPFDLEFGSAGVFPPRGRARVLWLGLSQGAQQVSQVHAHVTERLASIGIPAEERPYSPHLTIGRWRNDDGPRRVELPPVRVTAIQHVAAVTLFESRLLPSGAEHVPLVGCALGGARVDPVD